MNAEALIQDQNNFVIGTFVAMPKAKAKAMVYLVVTLFASLVDSISTIVA